MSITEDRLLDEIAGKVARMEQMCADLMALLAGEPGGGLSAEPCGCVAPIECGHRPGCTGDPLAAYRLPSGAVAHLLHVTQPAISQWEMGKRIPPKSMQFALADVFQTERSWLFAEVLGRAEMTATQVGS